jgi:hypothetical protein
MEDRIRQYAKVRKDAVMKKMMPPYNRSPVDLADYWRQFKSE